MEAVRLPGPEPQALQDHLSHFSWKRTAQQILDCLIAAAARPPKRHLESGEFLAVIEEDREEPSGG
jgi:hypothetical protein